jgi:hypothetical protein
MKLSLETRSVLGNGDAAAESGLVFLEDDDDDDAEDSVLRPRSGSRSRLLRCGSQVTEPDQAC